MLAILFLVSVFYGTRQISQSTQECTSQAVRAPNEPDLDSGTVTAPKPGGLNIR